MTFVCFFAAGKTKKSIIDAKTENVFASSFIIIHSV